MLQQLLEKILAQSGKEIYSLGLVSVASCALSERPDGRPSHQHSGVFFLLSFQR